MTPRADHFQPGEFKNYKKIYIPNILDWTQTKKLKNSILWVELLFLICFAGWAIVRAANPEAAGTEKPMELAFINAIMNSESMPPHDPWLSGYAISYYYFGYVIVSLIASVAGTTGAVAFNLGLALAFSLSATGSYGLLKNLLDLRVVPGMNVKKYARTASWALLGPVFLLLVSNLEGFLHILHNRGFFWVRDSSGNLVSGFWDWLDISELNQPPTEPFSWIPERFWWWWRASRVIQDYDLAGNVKEIINEFPFFSFLLGDLHPHVLALPFALLVVAFALNNYLEVSNGKSRHTQFKIQPIVIFLFIALLILGGIFLLFRAYTNLSMISMLAGLGLLVLSLLLFIWIFKVLHKSEDSGKKITYSIHLDLAFHVPWNSILMSAFLIGSMISK